MIQKTEQAILDALGQEFPDCEVESYPESIQDYTFTHPRAAFPVVLNKSIFQNNLAWSRPQWPEFNVGSFTHGLRGDPGAYEVLERIEAALEGLQVAGEDGHPGGVIRLQRHFFIATRPGGTWIYGTNVELEDELEHR